MGQHTIATTEAGGGELDLNVAGIRREDGALLDAEVFGAMKDSNLSFADRRGRHVEEGGKCLDEED